MGVRLGGREGVCVISGSQVGEGVCVTSGSQVRGEGRVCV